jgi:hypothetical protein
LWWCCYCYWCCVCFGPLWLYDVALLSSVIKCVVRQFVMLIRLASTFGCHLVCLLLRLVPRSTLIGLAGRQVCGNSLDAPSISEPPQPCELFIPVVLYFLAGMRFSEGFVTGGRTHRVGLVGCGPPQNLRKENSTPNLSNFYHN